MKSFTQTISPLAWLLVLSTAVSAQVNSDNIDLPSLPNETESEELERLLNEDCEAVDPSDFESSTKCLATSRNLTNDFTFGVYEDLFLEDKGKVHPSDWIISRYTFLMLACQQTVITNGVPEGSFQGILDFSMDVVRNCLWDVQRIADYESRYRNYSDYIDMDSLKVLSDHLEWLETVEWTAKKPAGDPDEKIPHVYKQPPQVFPEDQSTAENLEMVLKLNCEGLDSSEFHHSSHCLGDAAQWSYHFLSITLAHFLNQNIVHEEDFSSVKSIFDQCETVANSGTSYEEFNDIADFAIDLSQTCFNSLQAVVNYESAQGIDYSEHIDLDSLKVLENHLEWLKTVEWTAEIPSNDLLPPQ